MRSPSGILGQIRFLPPRRRAATSLRSGFTQFYDPSTAHADPANSGRTIRNPFARNLHPCVSFRHWRRWITKVLPRSQLYESYGGSAYQLLDQTPDSTNAEFYHIKGDANISANDIVSGHFSQQRSLLAQKGWLPDDRLSSHTNENGDNVGLRYSHVFNPGLLNEARISYNRFVLPAVLDNTENVVDQFNIPGWHTNPSGNGFPTVSIATLSSSAPIREIPAFGPPFALIENTYQYLDTITWQKGSALHKVRGRIRPSA